MRGGAVTLAAQALKVLLQIGSTVALARILTPADFGIVAMVVAVTGFILIFKDMGLSMATVQRAEINHRQVSTLFWINAGLGLALALLTVALAPAVAWFYDEPRLLRVTFVLALAFLFGGLAAQHQALLSRQMRFMALAAVDILSMAAGVAGAIALGLAGAGYWALVWMPVIIAAVNTAGFWIAARWRPGLPGRGAGVGSMLAFGGYLTGFFVVNYFARRLDDILIGRARGAVELGFYSRAYTLLLLPIYQITAPVTAVAVPGLSRLQDEPDRYRTYYLKAIKMIAYMSMPLVAAMGVLSSEVVRVALGPQWDDVGPIFMVLAVAAFLQPVSSTSGWIYMSRGETKRMFAWACMSTPVIVASFLIGLPWGALGVARAYAAIYLLIVLPNFWFALRPAPLSTGDVIRTLSRPVALSAGAALAMALTRLALDGSPLPLTVAASLAAGAAAFLILARTIPTLWDDAREILETARGLRRE